VAQLVFLSQHITPYNDKQKTIRFGLLTGPGEMLHLAIGVVCLHGLMGQTFLWDLASSALQMLGVTSAPNVLLPLFAQYTYYGVVAALLVQVVRMLFAEDENRRRSGRALLLCLGIRCVPAVLLTCSSHLGGTVSLEQTINDGLFLSILTSDIIVAKMANRPVHAHDAFTMILVLPDAYHRRDAP